MTDALVTTPLMKKKAAPNERHDQMVDFAEFNLAQALRAPHVAAFISGT